jgi:hypothetical protein
MVALNYQTIDNNQLVNLALFEQNFNAGYVLKPAVLWNKLHPEYGRFNPFEKKKDAEYLSLCIKLISGQYLTENSLNSSFNSNIATSNASNNAQQSTLASHSNCDLNLNSTDPYSNSFGAECSPLSTNNHYHRSTGVDLLQSTSTFVELEIVGIPCDCRKEKTKTFSKNALNPIWNEEFTFDVIFF